MVCMAQRKMGTHTARQDHTGLCTRRAGLSIRTGYRARHGSIPGVQDNRLFCATKGRSLTDARGRNEGVLQAVVAARPHLRAAASPSVFASILALTPKWGLSQWFKSSVTYAAVRVFQS